MRRILFKTKEYNNQSRFLQGNLLEKGRYFAEHALKLIALSAS